jgi:hypothetical protein
MTQAKPKLQTFADFLAYTDGLEGYYELTNGDESYDNCAAPSSFTMPSKLWSVPRKFVPKGWR